MRVSRAFLFVSLFSYVTLLILVINDVRVVEEVAATHNTGIVSSGLFVAMMIVSICDNRLNLIWCGVFGAWALVSFLGLVQWYNHLGAMNLNVPMAIWDLVIGVAMYLESELYVD